MRDSIGKMLSIRRFKPEDAESVWLLHKLALGSVNADAGDGPWDDDLRSIEASYRAPGGDFLVGTIGLQVVAMGAIRVCDDCQGEIKRMRVHPAFHRRGFGHAILLALEARARELGLKTLRLDTSEGQVAAQKLYEKNGYVQLGSGMVLGLPSRFYEKRL